MSHLYRTNVDLTPHQYSTLDDDNNLRRKVTYLPSQTYQVTFKICKELRNRRDYASVDVYPHNTLNDLKEQVLRCRNQNTALDTFYLLWFDERDYEWIKVDDSNPIATIKDLKLRPGSIISMDYRHQHPLYSTSITNNNRELTLKLCKKPMNRTDYIILKIYSSLTLGQLRKEACEKFNKLSKNQPLYLWNKDSWIELISELDNSTLAELSFESFVFISLDTTEENFDSKVQPGLCGLINLGSTCFMNSAFQCLSNIPEYTKRILAFNGDINAPVIGAYTQLIKDMWSGQYRVMEPSLLLINISNNLPRYAHYRQQDAQEFMNHFLHLIHEEFTNKETLITELFYGQIYSNVKCLGCDAIEKTKESISFLPLPIGNNNNQKTFLYVKADGEQSLVSLQINSSITTVRNLIDHFIKQHEPTLSQDQIQAVHLDNNLVKDEYDNWKSLSNIREEQLAFIERPRKLVTEKYIWCQFLDHSTGESFRPPIYLICPRYQCRYTELSEQIDQLLGHLCSMTNAPASDCYIYWIGRRDERYELSAEASKDEDLIFLSLITIEMVSKWIDIYKQHYNFNRLIDNSSLISLLTDFFREESLDGNYHCSKCPQPTKARQKSDLCLPLPHVLIIQLKRFTYDIRSNDKIDTYISFPLYDLDLNEYIAKDNSHMNQNNLSTKYDLIAVSNHTGSLTSGHYTTYAKNIQNRNWYSFDDDSVQKLNNDEDIITKNAYILVYINKTS